MLIDPVSAVLGVAGVGMSLFGASQQDAAAERAADAQYKSALKQWRFNKRELNRRYRYDVRGQEILKDNTESQLQWQEKSAELDYKYRLGIQDFEYNNAVKQYNQSEKNYKQQLAFNNIAAAQAYEAETRRMEEIRIGQAFQSQEMMLQNIQEEGRSVARGVSGRSAAKTTQSVIASYGRNIAILDESLKSAEKQHRTNLNKVNLDKLGADLAAEAARMLKPDRLPEIPPPLALPRPKYQNVYKPKPGPKPTRSAPATGALAGAVADSIGALASLNWADAFAGKSPLRF